MRRLILLLVLILGVTSLKAQTPKYLIFGKVPETLTRADIQRELDQSVASSRIYISRFLSVPEGNFNVVSFEMSANFGDSTSRDLIGPFTVTNRKDGDKSSRLPNEAFALLQTLALNGGRLFIENVQVQPSGTATPQMLKSAFINIP
ncbi:MAG: hypothetical protein EOP52_06250 [Sphingobacteriales bacterium]|nr:MAG: hypothetical protein EOP52_06250 [Sphingobacteriales bacterium]